MNKRLDGIDLSLYFITDTALCTRAGHQVADVAVAAIEGGAGMVQVRDKHLDDENFYHLSRQVAHAVFNTTSRIKRRIPVVINDRIDVVLRLRQEGYPVHIHVGQDDKSVEEIRQQLGPNPLIGLSAATPDELAAAQASHCVDLVGIGPVFSTQTKSDAGQALTLGKLAERVALTSLPAVAIGGINHARAPQLKATGIAGICAISAICTATDPATSARKLYHAFTGKQP